MSDLYPSRVKDQPEMVARRDPVLHPTDSGQMGKGPLDAAQLSSYEEKGFLFMPNLFDASEVREMQEELQRLQSFARHTNAPEYIREPESQEVRSIFAIHRDNDMFRELAKEPRLQERVQQVLGSEVYVHQSRINYKPGFTGKEFYWHSDFETWHVEDGMPRMRAVSFSILLDDNLPYNGALMVIPGSHRFFISCVGQTPENHYQTSLRRQEYGVPDHESLTRLVDHGGIDMPTGPAGSVLMFECNTMHGSNSNITPLSRRNLFLVYNSVKNELQAPFSGQAPRPEYIASRQHARVTS